MLVVRKSFERGFADHGWLRSWHSFSFAEYYDPQHMGFRKLRVLNQDIVACSHGFPKHGHRDMEIVTIVLRGTVEHEDSMGNKELVKAGEIQRMTAGTGIQHSECNPSHSEELELLQIWIEPEQTHLPPSYEQATISPTDGKSFQILVAPMSEAAPVHIHQDVRIYRAANLPEAEVLDVPLGTKRFAWIQVISGSFQCRELTLSAGDAVAVFHEAALALQSTSAGSSCLLFDLA